MGLRGRLSFPDHLFLAFSEPSLPSNPSRDNLFGVKFPGIPRIAVHGIAKQAKDSKGSPNHEPFRKCISIQEVIAAGTYAKTDTHGAPHKNCG
jgi:hypothetical protein